MKYLAFFLGIVLVSLAAPAWGQDEDTPPNESGGGGESKTIYKKTTVYDFEDDTINGDLTRPDGEYLESRKRSRHQNLIKIREDFNQQVIESIRSL